MKTNSKLAFQNYGTSILIFVEGLTAKDAYEKWLSLANWGATSLLNGEEPKYCAENVISCWSTIEQLQRYLFDLHITQLCNTVADQYKGEKYGFLKHAWELAKADFDAIATESFRSVNSNFEFYDSGVIGAEKEDDNFLDACLKAVFSKA